MNQTLLCSANHRTVHYDYLISKMSRYFQISDISFDEEKELDIYDRLDAERIKTCNGWTTGESISDMSKTMVILYNNHRVQSSNDHCNTGELD